MAGYIAFQPCAIPLHDASDTNQPSVRAPFHCVKPFITGRASSSYHLEQLSTFAARDGLITRFVTRSWCLENGVTRWLYRSQSEESPGVELINISNW